MLKIEHLNKNFKTKEVLKDLNLEVHDGSIFGLVGINGAGKSTLLRLIAGVYEPEGGTITLNGKDTWKDPEIRSEIAFVSDEQYYPLGCTIQSLKLLYESMYNFDEAAWHKYMEMFDLEPGMSVTNLSKGMKRRVSLLYALSIHPKLILLDEAYDGLEPLARLHFKQALTDLIEDENVSVVISSHNLKELEDICDSFGILEDGHIISYGDLLESRELINKYQVVFRTEHTKEDFKGFDILHFEQEGRVCKLVIRGNEEEVTAKLDQMDPVLMDVLQTNFEELFIYELESRGETK
ncbi:MAG: ABC transporter ATP-binding protein [Erysipelotrichaceae bacterium]|nr:ABC transporter ATP-binding protein [Solobacterium sp.]MDO4193660.1 ABC transporter ATP-binding protein [Erysipelotrichaceae bacterium]MDO5122365.1 ABC transporter ATP-binding protein [Erysipelotrichaceae bacterium]